MNTLSKFTIGSSNLVALLGSQRSMLNKQGIWYKGKSNKTNARKFTDLSKPSSISFFYCNNIGHLSKACYCKKVGVSKGKFKWIPKEPQQATKSKDPKFIWIPTTQHFNCFAGN